MGIDLLILLTSLALPHPVTPRPRRSLESGIIPPHVTYLGELIAVAAAVTLPVLAVAVCRFCDPDLGGEMAHFLLLCLAGLQTVIYRSLPLPRKDRTVFLTTMALVLAYVAALAAALASGLWPIWALAAPLASPVLYLTVRPAVKHAMARKGRSGK
jgi:hypothetical protein